MDEVFNKMESGAAAIAPYYAGDFLSMYENNQDLAFYYTKEGTNVFVDSICIPKNCGNKKAAELYINFLLDPNVALQNAETICYACPNNGVVENEEYKEFLSELHPDAFDILYPDMDALYPDVDLNNYYFHDFSADMHKSINDLWNKLKIESGDEESSTSSIYIICGVVIVLLVVAYVISRIKKKKREEA